MPVAVNEFGVIRWVPNAADFMRDEMDIFEGTESITPCGSGTRIGSHGPKASPNLTSVTEQNPENTTPVENDLQTVILEFWARNTLRPSNFNQSP